MSGAQIEEVLRKLGASLFGNKTVRALTILNTLAKRKAKGETAIAEVNYKKALREEEQEQSTKPAPVEETLELQPSSSGDQELGPHFQEIPKT